MPKSKKKSNEKVQVLKGVEPTLSNLRIVNSAFADAIKTLNASTQFFTSITDTQKRLAESIQTALAPSKQMNEAFVELASSAKTIQNNFNKFPTLTTPTLTSKPLLPNFAGLLPEKNTILKAVQSGFKMSEVFKSESLTNLTRVFEDIKGVISLKPPNFFADIAESVRNLAGNIAESIRSTFNKVQEYLGHLFRAIKRSNILIIVSASKGDKLALYQLGILWWRLGMMYMEIERQKGREPTKKEFQYMVQIICWEVLNEADKRQTPFFEIARIIYYSIIAKLFVDYVEVLQTERFTEATEVKIINQTYRSNISVYHDENNKPNLFVKTVAQELGVSTQTVRNWVKSGQITGIKVSYASRIRHAMISAYLLPYEASLLTKLRAIKAKADKKKRHQLDNYFTISQVASWYNLSRKTLERWDKEGKLVPKRITGIRYYTEAQRDEVPNILMANQSPRIKGLIASRNLSLS